MSKSSDLLHQLNAEQKAAVLHTEGPLLVLAGAGSGKTRVVTSRIAHLLNECEVAPSEILAVTFTNKAANEMRARVVGLVGKKRAAGLTISTFHSFCLGVLRKDIEHLGYRKNFVVSSEADSRTLLRRVLNDMDGVHETFSPSIFREEIGRIKGAAASPTEKKEKKNSETATQEKYRKWVPSVYEAYQSALRAANALDFDDLLAFVLRLWDEYPEVLKSYQQDFRYVMVDEYQDTNQVQHQLLKRLVSEHRNICVVGDDDQSIYGWRGADVGN
ncbi:MAG: UvrD-helicase domain-containing protein, partial [Candidatus Hydrogenedentes bacterium]|nr:UvrD-helicase domain-containing protein [Candidatus Hydrogenedentota bacterium]